MPSSFVVDSSTSQVFAGRTLLLDTNALLDAYRLPEAFYDLAKSFSDMGCDLVTTKTIAIEFLGGATDGKLLNTKKKFLKLHLAKA